MSLIGENKAYEAAENGIKIGEVPMSKETKGSWSELYYFDKKLISVIFYDPQSFYISGGEIVNESNMHLYTDDIEKTKYILKTKNLLL